MKFLPSRSLVLPHVIFIVALLFIVTCKIYSQNGLSAKVSLSAENEKLSSVLTRLSAFPGVNFTYNASDPSFDQRVTYSATDRLVGEIIHDILTITRHEYRPVGNHLVIVPSEAHPFDPQPKTISFEHLSNSVPQKTDTAEPPEIIEIANLIQDFPPPVRDTIRIVDVVIKTDTVMIRDTVFIERPAQVRRTRSGNLIRDVFRFEPDREDGWALSFSYAQLVAGYDYSASGNLDNALQKVKDAEAVSLRNFSMGAALQRNLGKFSLLAGVQFSGFINRFTYADITTNGGFFEIDTLDVFYTVTDGQQVFTYITDSAWVPLDRDALTYDRFNRIGLFEMQLGVGYTFYAMEDVSIYLHGGLSAGVPIWLAGSAIQNMDGYPAEEIDKDMFEKYTFGYQTGLGVRYTLRNWTDIYGELFYRRYLSTTTTNHPLSRRLHGGGVKIGLLYYF